MEPMGKQFGKHQSALQRLVFIVTLIFPFRAGSMDASTEASTELRYTFFDSAVVNDTIIRLGDIAAVSGSAQGISAQELMRLSVGEAAPAGYSRFVNTGDVIRYCLKARKITCRAESGPAKRISVRTDFQQIDCSSFKADLADYIKNNVQWPQGDYQLEIVDKNQKLKCMKQPFSTCFDGLPSKYPKGNFNCKVIIHQGTKQMNFPVSCFISVTTPVLVASNDIKRGTVLSSDNCRIEKKDITHFNYMPFIQINDIKNKTISRSIIAGTIIHEKIALPIPLINRDDVVKLVAIQGNIRACIMVKARESGGEGSHILVENEITHKLIKAKITKEGEVVLLHGNEGI
jgi:flagellar basal body P-ring formation protein FlgA